MWSPIITQAAAKSRCAGVSVSWTGITNWQDGSSTGSRSIQILRSTNGTTWTSCGLDADLLSPYTDTGGANGTAYSDQTAGNTGGQYRATDVDIEKDIFVLTGYPFNFTFQCSVKLVSVNFLPLYKLVVTYSLFKIFDRYEIILSPVYFRSSWLSCGGGD